MSRAVSSGDRSGQLHPTGGPLRIAVPTSGDGVWGREHHAYVQERLGRSLTWVALCEDLPSDTNRVQLSPTLDEAGLAIPEIHYRFDDNVQRMMTYQAARAEESFLEAGALKVESRVSTYNAHLLGTARMGDDPYDIGRRSLGNESRHSQLGDHRWQRFCYRRCREPHEYYRRRSRFALHSI